jgi:hypothetical protein
MDKIKVESRFARFGHGSKLAPKPHAPNNGRQQKVDPAATSNKKRSGNGNWARRKKSKKKRRKEENGSPLALADANNFGTCGNRTTASTQGFYVKGPKSTTTTSIKTGWSSCATIEVTGTNDMTVVDQWLTEHVLTSEQAVVGFDIEWKPAARFSNIVNPSALLQLAVAGAVLLVHIKHIDNEHLLASKLLRKVVTEESILKVGCAVLDDAFKLFEDTGLSTRGRVDLAALAETGGFTGRGLSKLAKEIMQLDLPKSLAVSMSNWEQTPLTVPQLTYAALDGWCACTSSSA